MILQNLIEFLLPPSRPFLEFSLKQVGIEASDVLVNARGLTGEQQRLVDALFLVLRRSMLSDGHLDERELNLATSITARITHERMATAEIVDGLLLLDERTIRLDGLSIEQSHFLMRVAFDISIADGVLRATERAFLESLARDLGLAADTVARLIAAARRRRSDTDSRSGRPAETPRTRLDEALEILGVQDPTDLDGINQAFRRLMLQYHPDRAGLDPALQREYTDKAQRLNWARDYLLS